MYLHLPLKRLEAVSITFSFFSFFFFFSLLLLVPLSSLQLKIYIIFILFKHYLIKINNLNVKGKTILRGEKGNPKELEKVIFKTSNLLFSSENCSNFIYFLCRHITALVHIQFTVKTHILVP